ncbi:MAG TPA: 16S rRNA (uracil(1498)-N(3))-methyltransferase [Nitrospiraceae bacterium]|nr:16S rRNA (uracil(1498)-N(3))-methyltransferase [Nitrospiraceae bacterium]
MPVFFIPPESVRHGTVTITGALLDHLRGSLRTQTGEALWVGNGRQRYRIRVSDIGRRELRGDILEKQNAPEDTSPSVTLGQAMLKGERMDWVVQKATELGVAVIVPLVSARVITRPKDDRLKPQQERWQRIALEAAQQAERWTIPVVSPSQRASDFFPGQSSSSLRLLLSERHLGQHLQAVTLPDGRDGHVILAVGPEGGWEGDEAQDALKCGFIPVTLGPRILRAETAAIASISILQSRLGELG